MVSCTHTGFGYSNKLRYWLSASKIIRVAFKIKIIKMINLKQFEVWFVTGSQHLYGEETLRQVAEHSQQIAKALNEASQIPVTVTFKPTVKTTEEIYGICQEANIAKNCIG